MIIFVFNFSDLADVTQVIQAMPGMLLQGTKNVEEKAYFDVS